MNEAKRAVLLEGPVTAALLRLTWPVLVIAVGGWLWSSQSTHAIEGLFWMVAGSYLLFGAINISALQSHRGWTPKT